MALDFGLDRRGQQAREQAEFDAHVGVRVGHRDPAANAVRREVQGIALPCHVVQAEARRQGGCDGVDGRAALWFAQSMRVVDVDDTHAAAA